MNTCHDATYGHVWSHMFYLMSLKTKGLSEAHEISTMSNSLLFILIPILLQNAVEASQLENDIAEMVEKNTGIYLCFCFHTNFLMYVPYIL